MIIELNVYRYNQPESLVLLNNALVEEIYDSICINGYDEKGNPYEYSFDKKGLKGEISNDNQDVYEFSDGSIITITYI